MKSKQEKDTDTMRTLLSEWMHWWESVAPKQKGPIYKRTREFLMETQEQDPFGSSNPNNPSHLDV